MTEPWQRILDETDWAAHSHAYGTAEDTPGHLRAILGQDAVERRAAETHLDSAIIHQGTPWPATLPTTRTVVGLLQDPLMASAIAPSRDAMRDFLAELDETLSQPTEEDWHRIAAMADNDRNAEIADWSEIEDDDVMNAHYARCMLRLRELRPAIHACL